MHSTINSDLIAPKQQSNKEYRNNRKKSKENSIIDTRKKSEDCGVIDDKKERVPEWNIGYN